MYTTNKKKKEHACGASAYHRVGHTILTRPTNKHTRTNGQTDKRTI